MSDKELERIVRRLVDESGELGEMDQQRLASLTGAEAEGLREQLRMDQLMRLEAEATTSGDSAFIRDVTAIINEPSDEDDFMQRIETLVEEPQPIKRNWAPWIIAAAAAVIIGFLLMRPDAQTDQAPQVAIETGTSVGLRRGSLERPNGTFVDFGSGPATIVRGRKYQLSGPREGKQINPGRYILSSGVCHLRLQTGTSIVLEAPTEFSIADASTLRLHTGRLHAVVPSNAVGFRVITDHCRVIDLSTEFGVATSPEQGTFVQTFLGLVEIVEPSGARTELPAPDVGRFGGEAAFDSGFVTAVDLRMLRWQDHRDAITNRDDLMVYYDFQGSDVSRLIDHAGFSDAQVTGTLPVQGRWSGKGARQFESHQDVAELRLDRPMSDFTIAAWINVDRFSMDHAAILNSSGWQAGDLHLQLTDKGALSLGIAPTDEIKKHGDAHLWKQWRTAEGVVPMGHWAHVAVRANVGKQEVTFFVNGQVIEKQRALGLRTIVPGEAAIGRWLKPRGKETRPFRGRIDELVILGSALANEEVQALYKQNGEGL